MNEEQWLIQNFKGDPCPAIADKLQALHRKIIKNIKGDKYRGLVNPKLKHVRTN